MLALVVAAVAACAFAQIIPNEPSIVLVTSPAVLEQYFTANGGIRHNEATFGIPAYGDSVTGNIIIPDGTGTINGCSTITADPAWGYGFILMLPRGQCSFEEKVFNAQQAGAVAVLIADTYVLCGDKNAESCTADCGGCGGAGIPAGSNCECFLPYMGDDHTRAVSIPSFLVSKNAADYITACTQGNAPSTCPTHSVVTVTLKWPLPLQEVAQISMWSTPDNDLAGPIREELSSCFEPLAGFVNFTGRAFVYDGQDWGCLSPDQPCGNQCAYGGRYCSPDPDGDLEAGHTGADIVQENLRQICLFNLTGSSARPDHGYPYWQYVNAFYDNCLGEASWSSCSQILHQQLGISFLDTANCVASSNLADGSNTRLQAEMTARENYLILTLPTFVVNEHVLRGLPTAVSLLSAVCNSLYTKPEVCLCAQVTSDWLEVCATQGINAVPAADGGRKKASSSMAAWAVALIALLIIAVFGVVVGGVIAYRRAHKNMHTMLDNYRQLEAEEGTGLQDSGL